MERLNEIMGRTMPRRPSNHTQQSDPYQGQHFSAAQSPQTEPVLPPVARQRFPEHAPQLPPPNAPPHPDTTYPYGNATPSRPNQQQYANSMYNQPYVQEAPQNHFNGPANYTHPYTEYNEPETQTFTHNSHQHSRSTTYPATDQTNEINDSNNRYNNFYNQNAQVPVQYRQNYSNYQPRQEQYVYHADASTHITQPGADAMNSEDIDDEEMGMRNGDWEADYHQHSPYRPSNVESRTQTRKVPGIYETVPAYIEPSTQPNRSPRNPYDTHNGARDNARQSSAYAAEPSTYKPRSTQPAPHYASQQVVPPPPPQPTNYASQGMPTQQPARQGRSQPLPHPVTHEQEARYRQRTTQPLNPQDLSRQRELASQLIHAHMRPTESPQQVQPTTKPERKEIPTPTRSHPARSTQQVSQAQVVQPLPATFVPSKPICTKCKGAGYLRANVPFGHPNFGKPIACECKEAERKEKRRQQLREISNLDAFRQKTFNTFNSRIAGVNEAYDAAREFAQEPDGWLKFIGPNGCGKTHLAAAIANQALNNGSVVLFETVPDLLAHLRAAFAPTATEVYDQLFSKMREAELLILDDLGTQQSSPWANEQIFQLINYRYNMGLPTVITGNPKGIQSIDERIRSRLSDAGLVRSIIMDRAQDYRPNNPHHYS